MSEKLEIGASTLASGDYEWFGSLDDIRIYNRALSEAEVKELYEFEKPKAQQASTATPPAVVTPIPVKPKSPTPRQLTLEEKDIVGTYEYKEVIHSYGYVFLDNGIMEYYANGKKDIKDYKWSIVGNEVHRILTDSNVMVYRINPDNSLTAISSIVGGKRGDLQSAAQVTFKKIK